MPAEPSTPLSVAAEAAANAASTAATVAVDVANTVATQAATTVVETVTESHMHIPYLRESILLLAVAGIIVPLFQRFRISAVLAYLLAGVMFGPFGLGTLVPRDHPLAFFVIANGQEVKLLAEFGVVFLLFIIGLELSPSKLWKLRRLVLGFGSLQIFLTASTIGLLLLWLGLSYESAIIIGGALTLSSTAIVMQLLTESHATATPVGRASFAILLCQDIAAVPLLVIVGVLVGGQELGPALLDAGIKAFIAVGVLVLLGLLILRPLFRLASRAAGAEAFFALALLAAVSTAALTGMAGLSMALGAFLAGMLLAESEYSPAIESHLLPFKGLLLGVFFMSVGMSIDVTKLLPQIGWLALALVGLMLAKSLLIMILAPLFRIPRLQALEIGLLLSQAGEFGFILISLAMPAKVIEPKDGQFALALIALSMFVTPLLMAAAKRLLERFKPQDTAASTADLVSSGFEGVEAHVIIAGFGRVGRALGEVLTAEKIPWIAFDKNIRLVTTARAQNLPVWYGDLSSIGLLERAGLLHAQALVVTVDDGNALRPILKAARKLAPKIPIFARTRDRLQMQALSDVGATQLMPENVELALQLSAHVLRSLRLDEDSIQHRLSYLRREIIEDFK